MMLTTNPHLLLWFRDNKYFFLILQKEIFLRRIWNFFLCISKRIDQDCDYSISFSFSFHYDYNALFWKKTVKFDIFRLIWQLGFSRRANFCNFFHIVNTSLGYLMNPHKSNISKLFGNFCKKNLLPLLSKWAWSRIGKNLSWKVSNRNINTTFFGGLPWCAYFKCNNVTGSKREVKESRNYWNCTVERLRLHLKYLINKPFYSGLFAKTRLPNHI